MVSRQVNNKKIAKCLGAEKFLQKKIYEFNEARIEESISHQGKIKTKQSKREYDTEIRIMQERKKEENKRQQQLKFELNKIEVQIKSLQNFNRDAEEVRF